MDADLAATEPHRPPDRRQPDRQRPDRRVGLLIAVVVVAVVVVGAAVLVTRPGREDALVLAATGDAPADPDAAPDPEVVSDPEVAPEPEAEAAATEEAGVEAGAIASPFAAFGPGWSAVDPGVVQGPGRAALAWTGSEVVVLHGRDVRAFDPASQAWRSLPPLPFPGEGRTGLVWVDDALVAVTSSSGPSGDLAARLVPGSAAWTVLDPPPAAPDLAPAGGGPHGMAPGPGLVWTGQRLIDTTHAAALDVGTGTWEPMPLPADVVPYTHLLGTTPVWDGHEVVLVSWTAAPGLAWDATGSSLREIPGPPVGLLDRPLFAVGAVAVSRGDGTVTLVSAEAGRNTGTLTTASGAWSILPSVPGVHPTEGCPYLAAFVGAVLLTARCGSTAPATLALVDGAWVATGAAPDPVHGVTTWLAAGDALVSWTTTVLEDGPVAAAPPRFEIWRPA